MKYPDFVRFLLVKCRFDPNRKNNRGEIFLSECLTEITLELVPVIKFLIEEFMVQPTVEDINWVKSEIQEHDPKGKETKRILDHSDDASERDKLHRVKTRIYHNYTEALRILESVPLKSSVVTPVPDIFGFKHRKPRKRKVNEPKKKAKVR